VYRAVLDAGVLAPSLQRDFLLQLATEEAFAPLWGTGILTELDYTLAKLYERRSINDSEERRHAFPGSEVNAPKDGDYDYGLNDPDDGHVAHAAVIAKADAIVTDDTRAGLENAPALVEADVETVFPNGFAANTVAAHLQAGVRAVVAMSKRRTNPAQLPSRSSTNS
jgi:predicted nucleic acid-binding protein